MINLPLSTFLPRTYLSPSAHPPPPSPSLGSPSAYPPPVSFTHHVPHFLPRLYLDHISLRLPDSPRSKNPDSTARPYLDHISTTSDPPSLPVSSSQQIPRFERREDRGSLERAGPICRLLTRAQLAPGLSSRLFLPLASFLTRSSCLLLFSRHSLLPTRTSPTSHFAFLSFPATRFSRHSRLPRAPAPAPSQRRRPRRRAMSGAMLERIRVLARAATRPEALSTPLLSVLASSTPLVVHTHPLSPLSLPSKPDRNCALVPSI